MNNSQYQIYSLLHNQSYKQINVVIMQICKELRIQTTNSQINDQINNQLHTIVWNQVNNHVRSQIDSPVRDQVKQILKITL